MSQTVERALRETPGVLRAYVNPATEMAYVEYDAAVCSSAVLSGVIASLDVGEVAERASRYASAVAPRSRFHPRVLLLVIPLTIVVLALFLAVAVW
ncbi:MAG: hypothetical protein HUU26_00225 [Gemmatimonadaceae bacterium]|nr:hypothetical protein [Gemmatimonadaceae bacterium]